MDKCHLCHSPWQVAELTPPSWRVLDGGQTQPQEPPPEAEQEEAASELEPEEPPEEPGHEGPAPEQA
jgi:hypothetical protein